MAQIKNLKWQTGSFSLHISDLAWPDQGVTALLGASGAGKTTLLKLLIGFLPNKELQWFWCNIAMHELALAEKKIGYVSQSYDLFEGLTVLENIEFGLRAQGLARAQRDQQLQPIIEALQLQSLLGQEVTSLSGGESQRVALARAISWKPRLLFLDEPFSALDTQLRSQARQMTYGLIEKLAIPTLIVTHFEEDLPMDCTRLLLEKGQAQVSSYRR